MPPLPKPAVWHPRSPRLRFPLPPDAWRRSRAPSPPLLAAWPASRALSPPQLADATGPSPPPLFCRRPPALPTTAAFFARGPSPQGQGWEMRRGAAGSEFFWLRLQEMALESGFSGDSTAELFCVWAFGTAPPEAGHGAVREAVPNRA